MKKFLLLLLFLVPSVSYATQIDLWFGWSLKNVIGGNYIGSDMYYYDNFVRHFSSCEEQANVCNVRTSGLQASKYGVFIEYFTWGWMDPGIYLIQTSGRFVWQNTDIWNICNKFWSQNCVYREFLPVRNKIKLSYTINGVQKTSFIPIKK